MFEDLVEGGRTELTVDDYLAILHHSTSMYNEIRFILTLQLCRAIHPTVMYVLRNA